MLFNLFQAFKGVIMSDRKAQVNIEFIGGSILFFSALIFVISSVFGALPKYENINQLNSLESTGMALGRKLINYRGFWRNSTHNGTNWEDKETYLESNNFSNFSLGLAESYHTLDPDKCEEFFNGFLSDNYTEVKTGVLKMEEDFRITSTEYIIVDTYNSFTRGNGSNLGITEPPSSDPIYNSTETENIVHYGNKSINEEMRWFLVTKTNDDYTIYISENTNFNSGGYNRTNASETYNMEINGRIYIHDLENSNEVENSERRVLIFRRESGEYLGSFGREPPEIEDNYVKQERIVTLNSNLIKMEILVW